MRLGLVNMDFDYATYLGAEHGTGYERLLRDCMAGDATLFQRSDMVEAGWNVIQPIIDVWRALPAVVFCAGLAAISQIAIAAMAKPRSGEMPGEPCRHSVRAAGIAAARRPLTAAEVPMAPRERAM